MECDFERYDKEDHETIKRMEEFEKNFGKKIGKKSFGSSKLEDLSLEELERIRKIDEIKRLRDPETHMHYTNPTKGKKNMLIGLGLMFVGATINFGACATCYHNPSSDWESSVWGMVIGGVIFAAGGIYNLVGDIQHWYHND